MSDSHSFLCLVCSLVYNIALLYIYIIYILLHIYIYTYILLQYLKLPEATGWTLSLLRSPAADLSKGSKPIVSAGRGVGRGLFAPQKSGNSDFMENRLMTEGAELGLYH